MLSTFLVANREELITRSRGKVVERRVPLATDFELKHGVPLFIDQLAETLSVEAAAMKGTLPAMEPGAMHHASDLLRMGYTVGQVVHDYGDICQAVTELAHELNEPITVQEFHTLNRCLDNVTAEAVTEYGRQRELKTSDSETERLGFLAHELRNLAQSAVLSFQMLRTGAVGIAGNTGAVHERTLRALCHLVDRALAEVRLDTQIQHRKIFPLLQLLEDVTIPANLEARARGVMLEIAPIEHGVHVQVEADRQLLAAAISNILQNAFKFTPRYGTVILRSLVVGQRVLIEVEDACGGLPPGKAEELFQPFLQRSRDRSGLGLGLTISRRAVDQAGGTISVRDLPGRGCIFTIELPVSATPE